MKTDQMLRAWVAIFATRCTAFTVKFLLFNRPESVTVIKANFFVQIYVLCGEESNSRKSYVPVINKYSQGKDVWFARVIYESADVSILFGINAKQVARALLTVQVK